MNPPTLAGTHVCPACVGRKGGMAHLNFGPGKGCRWEWTACHVCDGAGTVDDAKKVAWDLGREVFALRRELEISVREAAHALAVESVKIFAIEHGREPPPPDWRERLRNYRDGARR